MKFLFLFMDGVGLGKDDSQINPFSKADMPTLKALLGGHNLVYSSAPYHGERASLSAIDATLGVEGMPQSATGQAALLTGKNVSELIGGHYGPKPNSQVAEVIKAGTLFSELANSGHKVGLLNAYPQPYFDSIASGRRLYSAIPLALISTGIKLKTSQDLLNGEAITTDFTGEGWNNYFKDVQTPLRTPHDAGMYLGELTMRYDLAFFEYWPSDYAGHKQDQGNAIKLLETFDSVLGGLLETWEDNAGLIFITSDHGNIEDLSTRRHSTNPVPALVIGAEKMRRDFIDQLTNIADVTPAILKYYQQ